MMNGRKRVEPILRYSHITHLEELMKITKSSGRVAGLLTEI
jgi:hypothetical protein